MQPSWLTTRAEKVPPNAKAGKQKLALDEAVSFANEREFDLLALEEALLSLEKLGPRQAKIVELRFFGGLSIE